MLDTCARVPCRRPPRPPAPPPTRADQCVEHAVRDACDRGFLVTLVTDACATYSPQRQAASLAAVNGYCRQRTTAELAAELEGAGSGASKG